MCPGLGSEGDRGQHEGILEWPRNLVDLLLWYDQDPIRQVLESTISFDFGFLIEVILPESQRKRTRFFIGKSRYHFIHTDHGRLYCTHLASWWVFKSRRQSAHLTARQPHRDEKNQGGAWNAIGDADFHLCGQPQHRESAAPDFLRAGGILECTPRRLMFSWIELCIDPLTSLSSNRN